MTCGGGEAVVNTTLFRGVQGASMGHARLPHRTHNEGDQSTRNHCQHDLGIPIYHCPLLFRAAHILEGLPNYHRHFIAPLRRVVGHVLVYDRRRLLIRHSALICTDSEIN